MENRREILDHFGKVLMKEVRDQTIDFMHRFIAERMKSEECKELHKEVQSFSQEQIETLKKFINHAVDSTLFNFFCMISWKEEFDLVMYDKDQKPISLEKISDELRGELFTEEGWIEMFSKYPPSIK